jgi:phage terminase Nu1 subunit (DNA packaging protein)
MSDFRTLILSAPAQVAAVRDLDADALCRRFSVDRSTVKRWVARGLPCDQPGKGKPNRFNENEVAAWLQFHRLTGQVGRPDVAVPDSFDAYATATSAQVCRLFEISRRQLNRWMNRGLPFLPWQPGRARTKRFNVVALFHWLDREWPDGRDASQRRRGSN